MVKELDKVVRKNVEAFIAEVKKYYKVDYAVLFGSFAKGNNHEDSDIDIAVISSEISNEFLDGLKMAKLRWNIDLRIEPHAIKTNDYNNNTTALVNEIRSTGVQIYV